MSGLEAAIIAALQEAGDWIAVLALRDRLPKGLAAPEPFELALNRLLSARQLERKCGDDGRACVRLAAPKAVEASTRPRGTVPAVALSAAVVTSWSPAPAEPLPEPLHAAPEVISHAKPKESHVMKRRNKAEIQKAILATLDRGPKNREELIVATGLSGSVLDRHLPQLASAGKISRGDGHGAPWRRGQGAAAAPNKPAGTKKPRKAHRHNGAPRPVAKANGNGGPISMQIKLDVIERLAADSPPLVAFALREIGEDLRRAASHAP